MFEIIWQYRAIEDQVQILEFWVNHNKSNSYSIDIFKEVEHFQDLLEQNPYIGSNTQYKDIRRVIILNRFSLYYKIEEKTVYVLSFWDNSRDPQTPEILDL